MKIYKLFIGIGITKDSTRLDNKASEAEIRREAASATSSTKVAKRLKIKNIE